MVDEDSTQTVSNQNAELNQDSTRNDRPMSITEEVQSKGWTPEELVEHNYIGPGEEGTTSPVEHPDHEEKGAEIRDLYGKPHLIWEYREATIAVANEKFGKWRAEIAVPEGVAKWLHGPGGTEHFVRSVLEVGIGGETCGYIDEVIVEDKATKGYLGENVPPTRLVVYTNSHFQPEVELQSLVDDLHELGETREQAARDQERAFEAAKANAQSE